MANDFDAVLLKVGQFGRYQKLVVWLLCVPTCFMNVYGGFSMVFQGYTPPFRCRPELEFNQTDEIFDDECEYFNTTLNITEKCTQFQFDRHYFESTIITDFGLVCDHAISYKTALSVYSFFGIVGCFIFSIIQDQWGRKNAFILCITTHLLSNIFSIFAPNLLVYSIIHVPSSFGAIASWNIGYIWALEYVGPSKRTMVTFVMSVIYGVAAVSLGPIAWICRTWVQLVLVVTIPFFLLYSYWFVIDESPRWLLSQGRVKEAEKVVTKIARGQNEPSSQDEIHQMLTDVEKNVGNKERSSVIKGLRLLFETSNMRWKTLLLTSTWFSVSVTYVAIAYNTENLGGNLYVNYMLQAAVEIPATGLILVLFNRFGRVPSLAFAQIVCCSVFAFLAVPAEYLGNWAVITCAIAVKFGSCLAFACVCQLAGELYPTVIRGTGTGFSSSVGDMGNILMPYVIHSASAYKTLPLLILGVLSLVTGVGCLFLPETSGQLLPETLEEAEERGAVGLKSFRDNVKFWKKPVSKQLK